MNKREMKIYRVITIRIILWRDRQLFYEYIHLYFLYIFIINDT
jgi:hypothetical protein